ncbi:hypothetical protein PUMCH_004264 [Australozyma saopauloensis]|uniref:Ribonuclease P protein subunit n=1 Tax=Australozyma saopauloensis TaxID=291208 RepID=A0AAX4HER9_9ASCO|nr:hypothetical protein PUMCH_004264 [[Candida] saopauloensis]
MHTDYPVEKHLLSRSYTSEAQILQILETRYAGSEAAAQPFLALVPTSSESAPIKEKTETTLNRNEARKPAGARKLNVRRDMRVYIKRTLSNQRAAVSKLRQCQKKGEQISIENLLSSFKIPKYDEYIQLNELWKKYMSELLFLEQKNPDLTLLLPRLSSADYNGCLLTVLESRDMNIIGITGIVLFDAQHLFIVVTPQKKHSDRNISAAEQLGGLRFLRKKGTLFGFSLAVDENEYIDFTIMGSRFELRAVDRTAKKFKSHKVEDIY